MIYKQPSIYKQGKEFKLELEEITGVTFEINQRFTSYFDINNPKFYKYGDIIIVQNFNFIAKSTSAFTSSSSDPWNIGNNAVCMAKINGLDDFRSNNVLHTLHKTGSSAYWFVTSFQKNSLLNCNIISTGVNQSFTAAASSWYGAINTIII